MSNPEWKIIASSIAGTGHKSKNAICQDFFDWRIIEVKEPVLIFAVSDGAGSAKNALVGAQTTCHTILNEICAFAEKNQGIEQLCRDDALEWLKLLQTQLRVLAEHGKIQKNDFACTMLTAIIQNETAIFLQIGDGAAVYTTFDAPNQYRLVTQPQQGEYANATHFVTDENAADVLIFEKFDKRINEIAIFTDGLQRIALDYQTNSAHAPFFRPMFAPLRAIKTTDEMFCSKLENLQKQLSAFLDSPKINERTDDDKTLILASRQA